MEEKSFSCNMLNPMPFSRFFLLPFVQPSPKNPGRIELGGIK
jgi:hypothetical protein